MRGEDFPLISNVFGKGMALNCSHQLPSIIMVENPTKTYKL
jgi:hypothetical protein